MTSPLLLSQRGAARLLGVSPDALAELRRDGHLRTVPWPGRFGFKVALEEVQRIAREGVPVGGKTPRPSRRRVRCSNPAAGIRAIRVDP